MFIDFKAIKRDVSIEKAMVFLSLKGMTAEDGTYRGECPVCKAGSRSLVITPEKEAFYCHGAKKGGDVISLVAHLHGTSMKESGAWLLDKMAKAKPEKATEPAPSGEGFKPLDHLHADHDAVQAMGFPHYVAEAIGIGYSSRGLLRGYVAIPLRTEKGVLVGYLGVPTGTATKTPTKWWGIPEAKVIPISNHRKRA